MTHYESAINELAERRQGTDASLTTSIADILTVARCRSAPLMAEATLTELLDREEERLPSIPAGTA